MEVTSIWQKYQNGKEQHQVTQMYTIAERCHRFYEGDQWHGIKSGGEELPLLNIIKPIVKYKTAMVSLNDTAIVFTSASDDPLEIAYCDALSAYARQQWELNKMDDKKWSVVKNACITGDHYVYSFASEVSTGSVAPDRGLHVETRLVDKTCLYLADEQNPVLKDQEWIIIAERRSVDAVKREAEKNKIPAEQIQTITSDEVDETTIGVTSTDEVDTKDGKCTSLLYMQLTDEGLQFCRSTEGCIYQPMETIPGMDVYPVCGMRWEEMMGSARGLGGVQYVIPNQIEINKNLARRAVIVKRYAFPMLAYDMQKIANPETLLSAGSAIAVKNLQENPVSSFLSFITPPPVSGEAGNLQRDLIDITRELEGAGDATTGNIDPTKASGEAIKAARDQSALNLNEQSAAYKQFVEDLAVIWFKLWAAYASDGIEVTLDEEKVIIPQEALKELEPSVRIDVSPADPFSVLARQNSIENALSQGHITFDEYVSVLDDNSGLPKEKFEAILAQRPPMPPQGVPQPEMMGGLPNEMPVMQP